MNQNFGNNFIPKVDLCQSIEHLFSLIFWKKLKINENSPMKKDNFDVHVLSIFVKKVLNKSIIWPKSYTVVTLETFFLVNVKRYNFLVLARMAGEISDLEEVRHWFVSDVPANNTMPVVVVVVVVVVVHFDAVEERKEKKKYIRTKNLNGDISSSFAITTILVKSCSNKT